MELILKQTDGGRQEYKPSETKDCAVRGLAEAFNVPYEIAYKTCAKFGRIENKGTNPIIIQKAIKSLERRTHLKATCVKRSGSLEKLISLYPMNTLFLYNHNHAMTVKNSVLHDTFKSSLGIHVKKAWIIL